MRTRTLWGGLLVLLVAGCSKPTEGGDRHGGGAAHEEEEHGEQRVRLTPEAVRSARIQTQEVQRKPLSVGLTAPARVSFTQRGVAQVAARVPGRLSSIEVNLGQRVKKGQVLAYLESPELGQARADYLSAATKSRVAEDNFRREKELFD